MKNFYKLVFLYVFVILGVSCQATKEIVNPDLEEWISLFNGVDLTGWDIKITGHELNDNFNNTFSVMDSMIRVQYQGYEAFNGEFGHLYYHKPFSHYKLRFDYRFRGEQLKGGPSWAVRNSGAMLHSQSAGSVEIDQQFPVSVELQLLGGLGEGERTTGNVCSPVTAVLMADTINYNHCINSNSKTYHGDQWVHVEAMVLGGEKMAFIVEGDTVLTLKEPQIDGDVWESLGIIRDKEKWESMKGIPLTEGYIALQSESHPVDFKNIELLDLCGCMDPKAINYKSYYVKEKPESCKY